MVQVDDGSRLPPNVSIEVVCNGSERTVAHTTVDDDFGFYWNDNVLRPNQPGSGSSVYNSLAGANSDAAAVVHGTMADPPDNCDLRAELGGYTSATLNLDDHGSSDGPDLGVIWLHRIGQKHSSNLVSMSTLIAPKDATKSFDEGASLMHAGKWDAAAASFEKAVTIYPKYADAWLSLGKVQLRMGSADDAQCSFEKAIGLDAKLVGAWQNLGYLASNRQKWQDAAKYLDRALALDPLNSPLPWFVSALADYNLGRFEQAERSIRAEMKMESGPQIPRAPYLLGLILIARNDVKGGTEALRVYLASSPDPRDIVPARAILSRIQPFAAK